MYDASTENSAGSTGSAPSLIGIQALTAALSHLSDSEVEGLEDDLNFFAFTGITSGRIEAVLSSAGMSPAAKVANSNNQSLLAMAG